MWVCVCVCVRCTRLHVCNFVKLPRCSHPTYARRPVNGLDSRSLSHMRSHAHRDMLSACALWCGVGGWCLHTWNAAAAAARCVATHKYMDVKFNCEQPVAICCNACTRARLINRWRMDLWSTEAKTRNTCHMGLNGVALPQNVYYWNNIVLLLLLTNTENWLNYPKFCLHNRMKYMEYYEFAAEWSCCKILYGPW